MRQIYTVFPLNQDPEWPVNLPQDFDTYADALEYGMEWLGELNTDFVIESPI